LEVPRAEANKALAKRWFEEVWNEGRRETIRELLAAEAVIQEGNDASVGPEGFYPFFDCMQATFSDIHVTISDAISEDDKVCVRWLCMVRHTGNGIGISPANKTLHTTGHHRATHRRGTVRGVVAELGHAWVDAAD